MDRVFIYYLNIVCSLISRCARRGCGVLASVVDWKWNPPSPPPTPHFTRHPSIHPSIRGRGVWGSAERGLTDAKTAAITLRMTEIWAVPLPQVTAAPRDRLHRLCVACAGATLGRSEYLFPSAITRHVDWMKSTLQPVRSSSGLPACLLEWLHVDHLEHYSVVSDRLQPFSLSSPLWSN